MPRAFQGEEKQAIREALLAQGRALFARYGLRRATVRDLAAAVGIAPGSFYAFFDSKEALFFEILEAEERALAADVVAELQARPLGRRRAKAILLSALERFRESPLLRTVLAGGEYAQLRRRLPEARLREHVAGEVAWIAQVTAGVQRRARIRPLEPDLVWALLQTFFLLLLHEEEFAPETFPRLLDLLAGLVADHVVLSGPRSLPS
jgi:AcrR family transcriptional regulator